MSQTVSISGAFRHRKPSTLPLIRAIPAPTVAIPAPIRLLAEQLSKAQGCRITITREKSGYHIYLPCPSCLDVKGKSELSEPKYAINASKYCGIGDDYRHLGDDAAGFNPNRFHGRDQAAQIRDAKSGVCMRTSKSKQMHLFSVQDLLNMATIKERHPDLHTRAEVVGGTASDDRESHWEPDPVTGVKCPPPPGKTTPLIELPEDHPAIWYVRDRGFDPQRLWDQFQAAWCYEEYPHGTNGIYYRKLPGGWRDTPQGRIIFRSMHQGVPMTWQGRFLEYIDPEGLSKYALNPYTNQWDHMFTRAAIHQPWFPLEPFDQTDEFGSLKINKLSKYRTASHSYRSLMGWDAALANPDRDGFKWCVLCEGPMDAARVGPGGMALIGKTINAENAAKVASNFHLVFTAFDNDQAGRDATESVAKVLMGVKVRNPMVQQVIPLPIPDGILNGGLIHLQASVVSRELCKIPAGRARKVTTPL